MIFTLVSILLSDSIIYIADIWVPIAVGVAFIWHNYWYYLSTGKYSYSFLNWTTLDSDPTYLYAFLIMSWCGGIPTYAISSLIS